MNQHDRHGSDGIQVCASVANAVFGLFFRVIALGTSFAKPVITMMTRRETPTLPAQNDTAAIGNAAVDAYARPSQLPTNRAPAIHRRASGTIGRQEIPERVIVGQPLDADRAQRIHEFVARYERRAVGSVDAGLLDPAEIPVVLLTQDDGRRGHMDIRSRFILSLIDGFSSIELIIAQSGMPPQDAVYALCDLVDRGMIHLV
jgi:hypothetical protein